MSKEGKPNNGNQDRSVPTCDSAIALNSQIPTEGRVTLANESFRNYSEVDRDAPPPPPPRR